MMSTRPNKRPIAYWSRSLQPTQMKYTTTEKELLVIVFCLKEYKKILYSATINIYNDHKNLTFKTLSIKTQEKIVHTIEGNLRNRPVRRTSHVESYVL